MRKEKNDEEDNENDEASNMLAVVAGHGDLPVLLANAARRNGWIIPRSGRTSALSD